MKSTADLQRLREIDAQQATLIYRLTELKQEEDAILAKYPAEPVPAEVTEKRKTLSERRAIMSKETLTAYWKRRKAREQKKAEERADPRLKYFQPGRG